MYKGNKEFIFSSMGETIQIKKKITGDGKSFTETKINETVIKKPEPLGTININTDEKREKEDEIIQLDFQDENVLNDFAKQRTKEAEPLNNEDNKFNGTTTEEIKAQILREEELKSGASKPEDVKMWASLLINIFDTGISQILKFFSGDTSAEPYSMSKPKKNELADQLTLVLIKHSAKFKIEILFLLALVAAYAGPVGVAISTRKKIKGAQNQLPPPDRQTAQVVKQEIKEVIIDENKSNGTEKKQTIRIRRRVGNPGKGDK